MGEPTMKMFVPGFFGVAAISACLATQASLAATTLASGSTLSHFAVVTNTLPFTTGSTTYVNVTGASASVTVAKDGYIRARFSGETLCGGEGGASEKCSMRVGIVGGAAFNPKSGIDFAMDSNVCCAADVTPEAHAMEWISDPLPAGTYMVKAQAAVSIGGLSFTIDDWTFSVEALDP